MNKLLPIFFILLISLLFFWQFLFKNLLPIPGDTIIGLYHPFRDLYAKNYPNGIPFKNFLITDPVRQQYPWRELTISLEKRMELPLWNPYNFSGAPLLANFQSAPFYPLNILLFLFPFPLGWSFLIILQIILSGIFIYLYLDNLKLNKWASLLGSIAFSFSGFSIAWFEWGTILNVGLWLPLILLSIDKVFNSYSFKKALDLKWMFIFLFALISSFFAGHLQTFFYVFLVSLIYFFIRFIYTGKGKKLFLFFSFSYLIFIVLTAVQWIPTFQFILESARNVDQVYWQREDWFIPYQHLIQFIAPDFFGNPTTLNYWGVWNYGEFIGYVGIVPLIFSFFALFFRHDKKTLFFGILFFLSLIFSLPTFLAKLPFILNIPLISTAQPTRLLFLTDFSLVILSALGFDYFIKNKSIKIIYPLIFIGVSLLSLWIIVLKGNILFGLKLENLLVSRQNIYLPTILFIFSAFLISVILKFKSKKIFNNLIYIVILVTVFDFLRFGFKFTPFTKSFYLFPSTKVIDYLKNESGNYRIMATDSRILPPNFSAIYRLQSVDGYDPLYLRRYGEFIIASERGKADISTPFGFNRIITPHNYDSRIIDLLGVKYILSLSDLTSIKLKKVFQEGETRIYENKNVLPRAFFVENIKNANSKQKAIEMMFGENIDLQKTAIIEEVVYPGGIKWWERKQSVGNVKINNYSENRIVLETENKEEGFLVLTDSFYPTWKAKINGLETRIYRADYNFRGIVVPKGKNTVKFYDNLF